MIRIQRPPNMLLLTVVVLLGLAGSISPELMHNRESDNMIRSPAPYLLSWSHLIANADAAPMETMRNPAAVYCRDLGFYHEIVTHADGAQSGICRFPDGEACDDWAFLNGGCGQTYSACARAGLQTRVQTDGGDPFASTYAVCVNDDGVTVATVVSLTDLMAKCTDPLMAPIPLPAAIPDAVMQPSEVTAPSSFDWRNYDGGNWLTSIKNQGICGSCWAFSAVGVAEAALNILADNPGLDRNLSEQYLVTDCSLDAGACDGGYKNRALSYIVDYGIPDENCLPYGDGGSDGCTFINGLGNCDASKCNYSSGGECSDYRCSNRCSDWASRLYTIPGSVSLGYDPSKATIKQALIDHGPLAVSMGMNGTFSGGIYRCADNNSTNHAVIIVGYSDSGSYWIVRNSWGSSWDGDGYFNVAYDNCAIQKYPYYAITCVPPAESPSLLTPSNGTSTCDTTPPFDWSTVSGATSYRIQVDDSASFSSPSVDATRTASDYTPASALPAGINYWRVMACNNCGCSPWSASRSFTIATAPSSAPSLVSPAGGATTCDTTPALDWADVTGATSYQVQIDDSASFSSPAVDTTTASSAYTPGNALVPDTYYWRARACSACGCGTWSANRALVINGPPAVPALVSPVSGAVLEQRNATFAWTPTSGATYCRLQVSGNATFSTVIIDQNLTGNTYTAAALANGTYHWRMSACGTCGCSPQTAVRTFAIDVQTTSIYLPLVACTYSPPVMGIANSNFEAGATGWQEYSAHGWPIIVSISNLPDGVAPHSGSWAAWLGGEYDEISYVEQSVIVPGDHTYLAYWHWIASGDTCGHDFGGVVINGSDVVDVTDLCLASSTSGWVYHTVDLSAYAGQQVALQIRAETDDSQHSNLFIDDVAFVATPAVLAPDVAQGQPEVSPLPKAAFLGSADGELPVLTDEHLRLVDQPR